MQKIWQRWAVQLTRYVSQGCFNPTQAGHSDLLGNDIGNAGIIKTPTTGPAKKLVISPFIVPLYNGDQKYDYIENEEPPLEDVYENDGGNSDNDGYNDNANGLNTYNKEASSPFIFTGDYEDFKGKTKNSQTILNPTVRHSFEYRFRNSVAPKSLEQFRFGTLEEDGVTVNVLKTDESQSINSIDLPIGSSKVATNYKDLSTAIASWTIRFGILPCDWNPQYRYCYRLSDNQWISEHRPSSNFSNTTANFKSVIILADSESSPALVLYRPNSELNQKSIVVRASNGSLVRERDRSADDGSDVQILDTYDRANLGSYSVAGFKHKMRYLLNSDALDTNFEGYRAEYFIIYAQNVTAAKNEVNRLDAYLDASPDFSFANINPSNNNVLDPLAKQQTTIYPNPATNLVNLKLSDTPEDVIIYDMQGKQVYIEKGAKGVITIPTSQIGRAGTYNVKTTNGVEKLIINQ